MLQLLLSNHINIKIKTNHNIFCKHKNNYDNVQSLRLITWVDIEVIYLPLDDFITKDIRIFRKPSNVTSFLYSILYCMGVSTHNTPISCDLWLGLKRVYAREESPNNVGCPMQNPTLQTVVDRRNVALPKPVA